MTTCSLGWVLFAWVYSRMTAVESFGGVVDTMKVRSSRSVARYPTLKKGIMPVTTRLTAAAIDDGDSAPKKKKSKKKKSSTTKKKNSSTTTVTTASTNKKKKSSTKKKQSKKKSSSSTSIVAEEVVLSEEAKKSQSILLEVTSGERDMPDWYYAEYQEEILTTDAEDDDPTAIDPETLGKWDETDLMDKLEYEFDLAAGDPNPNDLSKSRFEHVSDVPIDEDGVEVGYDPIFGRSNPIDERTIVNPQDSYVIDELTRDDAMVEPTFPEGDLEIKYNEDVTAFRKSLKIVETYIDPYLNQEVPRHVSKWYGEPESMNYPDKPKELNFFTPKDQMTNFDDMTPYRARKTAIQLARAKNNEWMPEGTSVAYHNSRTDIYSSEKYQLTVGSFIRGDIDPDIQASIEPALDILGSVAELIEIIDDTIFRFHYHGLIKHKAGMEAWTETLIRDECNVEVTNVIFETGWRKRDPYYDGGDHWFGPY